jgi:DNA gyrase subunit A
MGRPARGVRAMSLVGNDYLVGMETVDEQGLILTISEMGFGKRTPLVHYRLTARGGKGIINMKATGRTGKVVAIMEVKDDSEVMIITKDGKIIRIEAGEIRQVGRSTQGVRLVRMEEGDRVAAACVIPETEVDNGKDGGPPSAQENLPLEGPEPPV